MKLVSYALIVMLAFGATPAFADEAPKQGPAEVTPNEAWAWLVLFEKIVDTVVANRDDCPKMAGGLNTVIDANQDTIKMAREAKARGKKLPAFAQQRMVEGSRRMVAALDKCGRDADVGAAFKRIDLGSRSK